MSLLLLLMFPLVALAAYRILQARGVAQAPAIGVAATLAVVATAGPAIALRPKPSGGRPTETPVAPAFARTDPDRVDLLVDFTSGWSEPVVEADRTIRRLAGAGQLTVGVLNARRPRAVLTFTATSDPPSRLVLRLGDDMLSDVNVGRTPTPVRVNVPEGRGPAVLDVALASRGVLAVWLDSMRASASVL